MSSHAATFDPGQTHATQSTLADPCARWARGGWKGDDTLGPPPIYLRTQLKKGAGGDQHLSAPARRNASVMLPP